MDNLVFSLNATVPIFLMMILGLFFNKIGWMDEEFANKMNLSRERTEVVRHFWGSHLSRISMVIPVRHRL